MATSNNYFVKNGFRFRVLDDDYDYCDAKSVKYKFNKQNWQRAMKFKEENERDFVQSEFDCTGSTSLKIDVKRKGKFMYLWYWWRKDV